jgi:hypothetical protein
MRQSFVTLMLAAILVAGCSSAPTVVPPSPAGATSEALLSPERETISELGAAVGAWNNAATPVMADMNDPTLDVEHCAERTATDRASMRKSVAAMEASIGVGADRALVTAVREMIGSYADKMTAVDGVALAGAASDPVAMEAALSTWKSANSRRQAALPPLLEAARPFLTAAEISGWERALAGS